MKKLFSLDESLSLAAVCIINLILLLIGLNGGSPFHMEPDECDYGPHAIWMLKSNTLNPDWFANPASTYFYPLLMYYSLLRKFYLTTVFDPSTDEMRIAYEHMDLLIKVPRFADVCFTIATIPLIYLVGRKWLGKGPAIVAIIMYALCPEVIRYGQTLRTDPLACFLTVLGMLVVVKAAEQPERSKYALWGALVTALAASTRYFSLALTVPFVTTYALSFLQTKQRKILLNLLYFSLSCPFFFFCSSPFLFLDYKKAIEDLRFEAFSDFGEVSGLGFFGNLNYYFTDAMPFCLGYIMSAAVILGAFLLILKKRNNLTISFLVMLLAFFVGTSVNSRHWYRWLIPMIPGCSLVAGFALCVLFQVLEKNLSRISQPAIARRISFSIVSLLLLWSLILPLENDYLLEIDKLRPTGLTQMWLYIHKNIPEGTKIAVDLDWRWTGKWLYNVKESIWRPDFIPPRPDNYHTPADLAREGYQYMICERWNRLFYSREVQKYPVESHFYTELRKHAKLLYATVLNTDSLPGANVYNRYSSYELYDLRPLSNGIINPDEQLNPSE